MTEPRVCRECGEPELHAEDCPFVDARGIANGRIRVKDSECDFSPAEVACKEQHEHSLHCSGCAGIMIHHVCGKTPCAVEVSEPLTDAELRGQIINKAVAKIRNTSPPAEIATHEREKPTAADLLGSDPDFTGDEYMARIRGRVAADRAVELPTDSLGMRAAKAITEVLRSGKSKLVSDVEFLSNWNQQAVGADENILERVTDGLAAIIDSEIERKDSGDEATGIPRDSVSSI